MIQSKYIALIFSAVLIESGHAYELATSVYYPVWEDTDPIMQETKPNGYAKNYLDPLLLSTMSKTFSQELDPKDKVKRDAFAKRTLDALLGFHSKAVEQGDTGFFARISGNAINYPLRTSTMIDFLAIPILEKHNLKTTLNDYTTKLRKDVINHSEGSEWAGGKEVILGKRYYGGGSNYVLDVYPARLEGVKYNSFVSEIVTILNEAYKFDLQLQILEQIEKVPKMSHKEIESAVEAFNKKNIANSGLDHPVNLGYGYINSQKDVLIKSTFSEIQENSSGKKYLESTMKDEHNNVIPTKPNIGPNTDIRVLMEAGLDSVSRIKAPELLKNRPIPILKFTTFKMHLPGLKQLNPVVWGNYE